MEDKFLKVIMMETYRTQTNNNNTNNKNDNVLVIRFYLVAESVYFCIRIFHYFILYACIHYYFILNGCLCQSFASVLFAVIRLIGHFVILNLFQTRGRMSIMLGVTIQGLV